MFFFARDDRNFMPSLPNANLSSSSSNNNKFAQHRMLGLRHNPYVGTFHNLPSYNLEESDNASSNLLPESKNNPIVGVFRHSPSMISKSLGLKVGVMLPNGAPAAPVISRLQAPKDPAPLTLSKRNFVTSLRQIPVRRFSASSSVSSSSHVPRNSTSLSQIQESSDDSPACAICLEKYEDGDEILTLACSHCFHAECASKWFFQTCLNTPDISSAFSCPQCRQDHVALSEASSQPGSESICIAAQSFLSLGQSLLREGGYDFLSDCSASEAPPSVTKQITTSGIRAITVVEEPCEPNVQAEDAPPTPIRAVMEGERMVWSNYSDCGVPLRSLVLTPKKRNTPSPSLM